MNSLNKNSCFSFRAFTPAPEKQVRGGFTLIELLITIGILTVLAAVTIIIINPAQLIKQSRDTNRMAEINSINQALLIYQAFGATSFGAQNTIYLSLPDSDSQCGSYYGQLPAITSPWVYKCAPLTAYRNTNGTGWIPVDFTSIQSQAGSLFATLPIDPINTAADNLYYTYISGSWALSAAMESEKYIASNAANDGGQISTRFEMGNELALNANLVPTWACGNALSYAGQSYNTVLIGSQCWFAQHLNVGTMTAGANSQGTNCPSTAEIEKYCYGDNIANCDSTNNPNYPDGGLYQWGQAMCGSIVAGAQGICPSGWHIPTDAEWCVLEQVVDPTIVCDVTGWRGTNGGTKLKPNGASGFEGNLAGMRQATNGEFDYRANDARIWSSVESGGDAWYRYLYSPNATVGRYVVNKENGFSVRCLKD